jgi:hypothetical protein
MEAVTVWSEQGGGELIDLLIALSTDRQVWRCNQGKSYVHDLRTSLPLRGSSP